MVRNIVIFFFFFNGAATTYIYTSSHTLSLHDALPISVISTSTPAMPGTPEAAVMSTGTSERRSEEHTSELQSRELISYAVFCLKKKKKKKKKIILIKKKNKKQT